jgi:hypothetical protein
MKQKKNRKNKKSRREILQIQTIFISNRASFRNLRTLQLKQEQTPLRVVGQTPTEIVGQAKGHIN